MSEIPDPHPPATPPGADLWAAWLEQSHDLIALTDRDGHVVWANRRFMRAVAVGGTTAAIDLRTLVAPGDAQEATLAMLHDALRGTALAGIEFCLRGHDGAALWVCANTTLLAGQVLWTLQDTSALHRLAAQEQRQSERLEIAQEFGRLGVWEREIPSGAGRWDRHVFAFWGIEPHEGTPDFKEAVRRVHPDDHVDSVYPESTRRAGRYSQRYRVFQPDGSMRWIHSQWEVINSPEGKPVRTVGVMMDDTDAYELARSLDNSNAQLRLALEAGNIWTWRHDLKSDRMYFDARGYAAFGLDPHADGVPLATTRAVIHPDDRASMAASAQRTLETGEPDDIEVRYRQADGHWHHMMVRRAIDRNPAGEVQGFVGVVIDVTERVERARRTEELARRFENAARGARLGVWSATLGEHQAEVADWNTQMFELFDMVGEAAPLSFAEWRRRCVHPDDMAQVEQATRDYLLGYSAVLDLEFRILHRDAGVHWIVARADMDRGGDKPRMFGIAMDVTERHDALAALHDASERTALIARSAGIGVWEAAPDGRPLMWDEQMFHLRGLAPRPAPLSPEESLAIIDPLDHAHVHGGGAEITLSTQPLLYEFRIRLPDGSERWLASRSVAVLDARGTMVRRRGVNWDITETKNAALARQQALLAERESRAKSQFLARVSHELRTPLNAVLGFTQLLQLEAKQAGSAGQLAKLGHIRTAGEHLLTLIGDVLDLSSLEAGTLKLELQPVDLVAALAQVLPLIEGLGVQHQVSIHAEGLHGVVAADPARLRQILINLLGNAIKYNRPHGSVTLDASPSAGRTVLRVSDTGRGLTPEQLSHLFEPFNRLGMESVGIEGTGIGLTIVKALVERMGGRIGVTSQPGRGTVFEVTLPTSSTPAGALESHGSTAPMPLESVPGARTGCLLYIEDNPVNVLLVEELVHSFSGGLRVVSETTGAAGVARARSLRPELILIDMQRPDFDGHEVLKRLRAHSETAATPCVALSANAMPEDIERALASGFDDYWT
ncbi:MAG TPA: PAS domain-containing protein, partial [Burkholderiaceae bacterium]|nr:PAS domain-containing protein [Burkholderiaceae bacterium]